MIEEGTIFIALDGCKEHWNHTDMTFGKEYEVTCWSGGFSGTCSFVEFYDDAGEVHMWPDSYIQIVEPESKEVSPSEISEGQRFKLLKDDENTYVSDDITYGKEYVADGIVEGNFEGKSVAFADDVGELHLWPLSRITIVEGCEEDMPLEKGDLFKVEREHECYSLAAITMDKPYRVTNTGILDGEEIVYFLNDNAEEDFFPASCVRRAALAETKADPITEKAYADALAIQDDLTIKLQTCEDALENCRRQAKGDLKVKDDEIERLKERVESITDKMKRMTAQLNETMSDDDEDDFCEDDIVVFKDPRGPLYLGRYVRPHEYNGHDEYGFPGGMHYVKRLREDVKIERYCLPTDKIQKVSVK